ncbi:MAG TPA: hypothetical protein VK205_14895 [Prolixibacteraceae bacterium]|nr:hypothetical protein [Prolixibacteraceae bacterium]
MTCKPTVVYCVLMNAFLPVEIQKAGNVDLLNPGLGYPGEDLIRTNQSS